jgi:hypothetical protein
MLGADVSASPMVKATLNVMDKGEKLTELRAGTQNRFRLLVIGIAMIGYGRARVVCAARSLDSEMVIFGQGRTGEECVKNGVPKIYARPGQTRRMWCKPSESKHILGLAIDVSFDTYKKVDWAAVGRLADDLGLVWGGSWNAKDMGHFEIQGGSK